MDETVVVPAGVMVQGKHRGGVGEKRSKCSRVVVVVERSDRRVTWVGHDRYEFSAAEEDVWEIDSTPPEGFLTCRLCRTLLPRTAFQESNLRKDSAILSTCSVCRREQYAAKYSKGNKAAHRQRKYGVTPERFEEMLVAQAGCCAVCHRPEEENRDGRSLNVDHCHRTGRVRSLLCTNCNLALGYMGDDPGLLRDLATYVESWHTLGSVITA